MPDAGRVAPIRACVWCLLLGLEFGACVWGLGLVVAFGLEHVRMLTLYMTAIFAHLRAQQAWFTPPHSTFCAICLHSALFVCTQLIFNALRSVCRGDIPTLLSTLPALLSALPTLLSALPTLCLHYLHFCLHYLHHLHTVATKPNSIRDAFARHRESRFSVAPTNFTPSLYPHSLPAQHIICLYMQDNADEVQVVQAVQTKVQAV